MAREPFNSVYLDERPIEQYAKKREMIFLHEGVTIIEDAKKKKTGQIPPPEKKKEHPPNPLSSDRWSTILIICP